MNRKQHFISILLLLLIILSTGCARNQLDSNKWAFGPFVRPEGVNPIIIPTDETTFYSPMRDDTVHWESMATFNPAATVRDDKVYVLYRAEDMTGEMEIGGHTSRLGMAISKDGLHFRRLKEPVFHPNNDNQKKYEWPGGTEDPRIVESSDGTYVMTYTQWNRKTPRLAVATSNDLVHWEKHGPAFEEAYDGRFNSMATKSGAIVTQREGDHLVATKINGKYWMYWGVPKIHLATSENLRDWKPVLTKEGKLKTVLAPRKGYFDSWLVEAGPPAVITDKGILLIYNAADDSKNGISSIPDSTYTGGQALFDLDQPSRLLDRLSKPFIQPKMPFEKSGQYESGTTFLEGLVHFEGKWFLYYGAADSRVGVVVWDPPGS